MEYVGIREFRANLHKYTADRDTPITVTSHGEPIGYYIPVRPAPQATDFEALKKAA
ncbi:MAG: type II toxin-antitoxin system Phd/YefM family antitoxin, partial [Candidatus Tectomicrobia bacterium]|nr:type II toxin-antitoxin system Phd/YefM family antitoxin [Candidatus Tectomicrobia bacterium]